MKTTVPRIFIALLFGLGVVATSQSQQSDPNATLNSLVETERAFARTCVATGIRASFLAFFGDNAINFLPHPVNAREALLQRPAPAERPPVTLNWEPQRAEVSRAGDLGYTTGPTLTTDDKQNHKPLRSGYYFSVWRRAADGSWKVELDVGITTPLTAALPAPSLYAPVRSAREKNNAKQPEAERVLVELERQLAAAPKAATAFLKLITEDAQLNHDGQFPFIGRARIQTYLNKQSFTLHWEPMKTVIASSQDFAYSFGKYVKVASATEKKGYYVHVWRRAAQGNWKITAEVQTAPLSGKE